MSGQLGDAVIPTRPSRHVEGFLAKVFGFADLTDLRTCITLFLIIAVPTLACLSLTTGPFQALDESSHFYRAVQVSEGRVKPVISPERTAAGDDLDVNVHKLGGYYLFLSLHDWWSRYGEGSGDRSKVWATRLAGHNEFVAFSNTVIYFPLAYAAPAATIALLREFRAPPLAWLYGARLTNSALATMIFCAAMACFPEGCMFIFVLALMPRTLFCTAAVSADALLIPFSALLASLLARLTREKHLNVAGYTLLVLSTFFICINKIAYIPFVVLPPVIMLISTRTLSKYAAMLSALSILTATVWIVWLRTIGRYVFPIRHTSVPINVYKQAQDLISHPLSGVFVLLRTLAKDGLGYFDTLVGGQLGSAQARVPYPIVFITFLFLIGASLIAREDAKIRKAELAFASLIVSGAALAIFLLLYMQYTPLDAPTVDGVQGRYFIPLLPTLLVFLPKKRLPANISRLVSITAFCWFSLVSINTVHMMQIRYMQSAPVAGQEFGNPHNMQIE